MFWTKQHSQSGDAAPVQLPELFFRAGQVPLALKRATPDEERGQLLLVGNIID